MACSSVHYLNVQGVERQVPRYKGRGPRPMTVIEHGVSDRDGVPLLRLAKVEGDSNKGRLEGWLKI